MKVPKLNYVALLASLLFTSVVPHINESLVSCIFRFMPETAVDLDRFMLYTL
jgi:hypothetical protein